MLINLANKFNGGYIMDMKKLYENEPDYPTIVTSQNLCFLLKSLISLPYMILRKLSLMLLTPLNFIFYKKYGEINGSDNNRENYFKTFN